MPHPDPPAEPQTLPDLWHRWTEVVVWFARKRRPRRRVGPAEYEALHRDLVAACRRLADTDPDRREKYERLGDLAGPWLSTGLLERTDPTLLLDLMERCRAADRELGGRAHFENGWVRAVRAVAWVVLAGLLALLGAGVWGRAGGWLDEVRRTVRLATRDLGHTEWLLAGGAVLVLMVVGWLLLGRRT